MDAFLGSFKLQTSEGFDEVMARLGVGFITRKAGNAMKPTLTISKTGDKYTMKTTSTFKTCEFTFTLGEPFQEVTPDGRTVESTITMDGNVMNQVQVGDKTTYITRTLDGDTLKTTVKVDELISQRNYVRV
ncbi:unnamed protein product [Schistocephalus solidus]|uniref:FABP domain-containing protein n=1 Tax=Schistocephalus solidus TaxID=70667 RepID=A0A183TCA4_SCHSO|nr:unnamed protein product [Schistocephalus solidus]